MTVRQLIDWLSGLDTSVEIRVLGERNGSTIEGAARPIIGILQPTEDAPFTFCVLIETGT